MLGWACERHPAVRADLESWTIFGYRLNDIATASSRAGRLEAALPLRFSNLSVGLGRTGGGAPPPVGHCARWRSVDCLPLASASLSSPLSLPASQPTTGPHSLPVGWCCSLVAPRRRLRLWPSPSARSETGRRRLRAPRKSQPLPTGRFPLAPATPLSREQILPVARRRSDGTRLNGARFSALRAPTKQAGRQASERASLVSRDFATHLPGQIARFPSWQRLASSQQTV